MATRTGGSTTDSTPEGWTAAGAGRDGGTAGAGGGPSFTASDRQRSERSYPRRLAQAGTGGGRAGRTVTRTQSTPASQAAVPESPAAIAPQPAGSERLRGAYVEGPDDGCICHWRLDEAPESLQPVMSPEGVRDSVTKLGLDQGTITVEFGLFSGCVPNEAPSDGNTPPGVRTTLVREIGAAGVHQGPRRLAPCAHCSQGWVNAVPMPTKWAVDAANRCWATSWYPGE